MNIPGIFKGRTFMNTSILFKRYYLGCLAQASYMIGDAGKAVVIDPQRDVDRYLEDAAKEGFEVVGVIETHLHADFVSGHLELKNRSGATVYVSHLAKAEYEHNGVKQGDTIHLGRVTLKFLETPGHTPESISILASVEGVPTFLFSGDMLFIGEVGRPDLVGWRGHSREEMAHDMFRSLRDQVLTLPDSVEIWPAHGAGSTCGKAISDEPSAPIGRQRRENWGLKMVISGDEEGFVSTLTEGLPTIPPYFPHDVLTNRRGAAMVEEALVNAGPLSPNDVRDLIKEGVHLLDVRDEVDFAAGHIPGSINVPLAGNFAPWLGAVVPSGQRYVVVAPEAGEREALVRMARVGYEPVEGWLAGGVEAWRTSGMPLEALDSLSAAQVKQQLATDQSLIVLDVRSLGEFESAHVPGALNIPLLDLNSRLTDVPGGDVAVMCRSGYRSSIACSILLASGKRNLKNLEGGWDAWESLSQPAGV